MKQLIILTALSILGCTTGNAGNILKVSSARVIDGDTVEVIPLNNQPSERIRLIGIDAPESSQAYGRESTAALKQCIAKGGIHVEWQNKDKYDRLLGKVYASGVDCNLRQVSVGAAWHYKEYANTQAPKDRELYSNAQVNAQKQKLGLWRQSNPIKPSEYRHRN